MKINFRIPAMALLCASFVVASAVAVAAPHKKMTYELPEPEVSVPEVDEATWDAELKAVQKEAKRTVAQTDTLDDASALSDDARNLRSELMGGPKYEKGQEVGSFPGIQNTAQLDAFLTKIDDDAFYNKQAPDAQLAISQFATLRVWRSFFNRAMDLTGSANASHSLVVTMLRTLASGVAVYLPPEQWVVGMKYISQPTDGVEPSYIKCRHNEAEGTSLSRPVGLFSRVTAKKKANPRSIPNFCSDIASDLDFHDFLMGELIPTAERALARVSKIDFKKANRPVYLDTQFGLGNKNNIEKNDGLKRYLLVGEPERHAMMSGYNAGLSALNSLVAYNLDGFFSVMDQIGRIYGVGSIFKPEGASAAQRATIIRNTSMSTHFLTLNKGGDKYTVKAYGYLRDAINEANIAWSAIKDLPLQNVSNRTILDPRIANPFVTTINGNFMNLKNMMSEKDHSEAKSAIMDNEAVDVKMHELFFHPPKNLTEFLPQTFNQEAYKSFPVFHGVTREVHNYFSGMPQTWDVSKFQPYFPKVTDSEGVKRAARILSQTWGGWIVGLPMSAIVL